MYICTAHILKFISLLFGTFQSCFHYFFCFVFPQHRAIKRGDSIAFYISIMRYNFDGRKNVYICEKSTHCKPEDLLKCADVVNGPSSANPAISWGIIAYSSTLVHGLHIHSSGALVTTWWTDTTEYEFSRWSGESCCKITDSRRAICAALSWVHTRRVYKFLDKK